jgi:iron complex outermembrane recepter protein
VRDLKITSIGVALPLVLAMASPLSSNAQPAQPTQAPAAGVTATTGGVTTASSDQLSEIVVTGLRASLEKSLELKKDASVVIDSINQEELGRFPDADVADSLEHLPGITLDRTTGGEGQKVSVRGFGPQYNITTLNNRILATDDDSRDLAFDVLPSEVISGADVLKSSEASALEGSIGGTVNLRTASPFDNPGFHVGAHAEGNYNQMSDLKGQKYSAFVSDTNDDRTLGFLIGGVYSDNRNRTDSLNAYNEDIYAQPGTVVPCCITFGSIYDEKKREALSGSLEWRPNDQLKIVADGLWTHLQDPQAGYNQSYYFDETTDQNGNSTWSNVTTKNGLVTGLTSDNFTPEIVNNTTSRNVVTTMYGLNVAYQPFDRLKLTLDAYRSAASRPEGGEDSFVTAGLVSQTPYSPDLIQVQDIPHSLPSLNVLVPPSQLGLTACPKGTASAGNAGYCSYTSLMNSGFLNNNNYWSTHYDGLNGYSVHDQVTGFTLDGVFDAKAGILEKIQFGAGLTHRDKTRTDISNDWTNGSNQYGTLYQTAGCPVQCTPYAFGGFDVISFASPPNFMQGAGGSYPSVLPKLNVANLIAFLKSLDGKPNPLNCTSLPCDSPFNFASTLPQPNPFNSYDVRERTYSGYIQGDFGGNLFGNDWSGNLGVRIVRTVTIADTSQNVPVDVWEYSGANATQSFNVDYSAATAFSERDQYTEALPSLNLSYWLLPKTLQLRAAASEDISRPDLDQLAPNATNQAVNGTPILTYTGAAGLKPIKAYAGDLSAEWYYHPHAALTAALFYKRITNDIYSSVTPMVNLGTTQYIGGPPGTVPGTPYPWTVESPANGATETYKGVEVSWQHFLDMGLGTHIQVTHTWSPGDAVNAAPPTTFSASLIYDKGPFNADVNWDWTARYNAYCPQCTEVPGWPAVTSAFSWVTASVHYRIGHGFEVYAEGRNLSNAIARTYLDGNPLLPWAPGQLIGQSASGVGYGYSAYGRSYIFGASYRY